MTIDKLTPQQLMDLWQKSFGTLEVKWHKQFIESPYVAKILEYSPDEIKHCVLNPAILVEYVGLYRVPTERQAKKLSEILDHLAAERAKNNRAPLGTYAKRIDASGPEKPF